jgi:hypothetical protein
MMIAADIYLEGLSSREDDVSSTRSAAMWHERFKPN